MRSISSRKLAIMYLSFYIIYKIWPVNWKMLTHKSSYSLDAIQAGRVAVDCGQGLNGPSLCIQSHFHLFIFDFPTTQFHWPLRGVPRLWGDKDREENEKVLMVHCPWPAKLITNDPHFIKRTKTKGTYCGSFVAWLVGQWMLRVRFF